MVNDNINSVSLVIWLWAQVVMLGAFFAGSVFCWERFLLGAFFFGGFFVVGGFCLGGVFMGVYAVVLGAVGCSLGIVG